MYVLLLFDAAAAAVAIAADPPCKRKQDAKQEATPTPITTTEKRRNNFSPRPRFDVEHPHGFHCHNPNEINDCRTVNVNAEYEFRLKVTSVCVCATVNIVYILHTDTSRRRWVRVAKIKTNAPQRYGKSDWRWWSVSERGE